MAQLPPAFMNHDEYEPFLEDKLTSLLQQWSNANIGPVMMNCGPFYMFAHIDVMHSVAYLTSVEGAPICPGSFLWFDCRHYVFRCLYAYIRRRGIFCPEWEGADLFEFIPDEALYTAITNQSGTIRFKYPQDMNGEFVVQDLRDNVYFKMHLQAPAQVNVEPAPAAPGPVNNDVGAPPDNFIDLTQDDSPLPENELGNIEEEMEKYMSLLESMVEE